MPKSLILFRHAHSEWQSAHGSDHDRVLSPRGEQEAKTVGTRLKQDHALAQKILCSSAVRAQSTANIAHSEGNWSTAIETDKSLYNTNAKHLLTYIHKLSDEVDRVMFIGHEPTWSDISNQLLTIGNKRLAFCTAMMVEISFSVSSWTEIQAASGELNWILGPQ